MKASVIIRGELTDLNSYISAMNRNRFLGNDVKKKQTFLCEMSARESKLKQFIKPVKIQFHWYNKNSRKDIDNIAFSKKFILDGLVNAGVLKNDSRKYVTAFSDFFYIDKENPRTEIVIEEI